MIDEKEFVFDMAGKIYECIIKNNYNTTIILNEKSISTDSV